MAALGWRAPTALMHRPLLGYHYVGSVHSKRVALSQHECAPAATEIGERSSAHVRAVRVSRVMSHCNATLAGATPNLICRLSYSQSLTGERQLSRHGDGCWMPGRDADALEKQTMAMAMENLNLVPRCKLLVCSWGS